MTKADQSDANMLTTVLVAPERAAEWEKVWNVAREYARKQAGFHAMRLLRDAAQPGHYVVLSEWASRNDFDRFVQTSGLYWLDRVLELWQALPSVDYEEVRAGADTNKGG
jgi:quinol monooxygenase YgiN